MLRNQTHLVLQIDQTESKLLHVRRVVSIVPTWHVTLLPRRNGSTVVVSLRVGDPKGTSDGRKGISGSRWGADQEEASGDDSGESEKAHLDCRPSKDFRSFRRRGKVVKLQDLEKWRLRLSSFIPWTKVGVLRACSTLNGTSVSR